MIKTEKETITKKEALVILHNYAMDLTKISDKYKHDDCPIKMKRENWKVYNKAVKLIKKYGSK